MGEIVEFPSNGTTAQGYLAVPESGRGPGVIVIQEWWGLVPHIKDVADRFAAAGYVALAPDLFHGETTTEPDEAGKLMMAMNVEQAGKDMGGAVDHLLGLDAVSSKSLGVIGFCMGGGLALVLATQRPDAIAACAPYYGLIPWPDLQPDFSKIAGKVQGHFAAEDGFFSPEQARALEQQLRDLGKDAEIQVHEGVDHAFFNDTRPEVHHPEQAQKAWNDTLAFFAQHIK
ncbi:MAG: dienelactone hydrolase family protein [Actinobacteria bacterium]|nr:dienelactone hydrolase family protein [Actinomycetota bacterium]